MPRRTVDARCNPVSWIALRAAGAGVLEESSSILSRHLLRVVRPPMQPIASEISHLECFLFHKALSAPSLSAFFDSVSAYNKINENSTARSAIPLHRLRLHQHQLRPSSADWVLQKLLVSQFLSGREFGPFPGWLVPQILKLPSLGGQLLVHLGRLRGHWGEPGTHLSQTVQKLFDSPIESNQRNRQWQIAQRSTGDPRQASVHVAHQSSYSLMEAALETRRHSHPKKVWVSQFPSGREFEFFPSWLVPQILKLPSPVGQLLVHLGRLRGHWEEPGTHLSQTVQKLFDSPIESTQRSQQWQIAQRSTGDPRQESVAHQSSYSLVEASLETLRHSHRIPRALALHDCRPRPLRALAAALHVHAHCRT
jgi:hypothetical protein